jgi:ParB/RepB/Spo0J family partition protein
MTTLAVVKDDPQLGRPLPLRLTSIVRFEGQPRTYFDEDGIKALADSIQTDGQQVPIKVCTHPQQRGVFTLVDGERRFRAFKLIHDRTGKEPTIEAFVAVVRDLKEHFRLSTIANLHREDLSPLDEAAALARLKDDGETWESLAALRGKSTTYVQNYVKMHALPDGVKAYMDPRRPKDERLSVTSAIDIARSVPDPKLQMEIATEVVTRQLGVADTRALVGVRSDDTGYRLGGRLRRPSDDYIVLTAFIGRNLQSARRLTKLDMEGLYYHRDNEEWDRERDAGNLRNLIVILNRMLQNIEKKPK